MSKGWTRLLEMQGGSVYSYCDGPTENFNIKYIKILHEVEKENKENPP